MKSFLSKYLTSTQNKSWQVKFCSSHQGILRSQVVHQKITAQNFTLKFCSKIKHTKQPFCENIHVKQRHGRRSGKTTYPLLRASNWNKITNILKILTNGTSLLFGSYYPIGDNHIPYSSIQVKVLVGSRLHAPRQMTVTNQVVGSLPLKRGARLEILVPGLDKGPRAHLWEPEPVSEADCSRSLSSSLCLSHLHTHILSLKYVKTKILTHTKQIWSYLWI